MATNFKTRLHNRETLIGPILTLSSPEIAEIMSLVGFDFVWIDTEHAPIDCTLAQLMVQAVGGRCASLVRVPETSEGWTKKILDIGPDGIVTPQIKSAEQARKAIELCRYPPGGTRGVGASRAQGYGMSFQDYLQRADRELAIILQVEHVDGVQRIGSIVDVPGIDAILIGTADLSASLGLVGEVSHPRVVEAIEEIRIHCERANIPIGIFAPDPQTVRTYITRGFTFFAYGIDSFYLWQSAKAALAEVRGEGS